MMAGNGIEKMYPEIPYSRDNPIDFNSKIFDRVGEDVKSSSQILCFVNDNPNHGFLNEMMWAHYAGNHYGVCLEIDSDKFIDENKEQLADYKLEVVTYGPHEQLCLWGESNTGKDEIIKLFVHKEYRNLFLRKSIYWEHENEKRLVIFDPSQKFLSIKQSLMAIYIGLFMPYSYRPSIDNLIDERQTKIYDLYYESNTIKICPRDKGDFRPLNGRDF